MIGRGSRRMPRAKLVEYILFQDGEIRRLREALDTAEKELKSGTISTQDPGNLSETGARILEQFRETQQTAGRCMAALDRILKGKENILSPETES